MIFNSGNASVLYRRCPLDKLWGNSLYKFTDDIEHSAVPSDLTRQSEVQTTDNWFTLLKPSEWNRVYIDYIVAVNVHINVLLWLHTTRLSNEVSSRCMSQNTRPQTNLQIYSSPNVLNLHLIMCAGHRGYLCFISSRDPHVSPITNIIVFKIKLNTTYKTNSLEYINS